MLNLYNAAAAAVIGAVLIILGVASLALINHWAGVLLGVILGSAGAGLIVNDRLKSNLTVLTSHWLK